MTSRLISQLSDWLISHSSDDITLLPGEIELWWQGRKKTCQFVSLSTKIHADFLSLRVYCLRITTEFADLMLQQLTCPACYPVMLCNEKNPLTFLSRNFKFSDILQSV